MKGQLMSSGRLLIVDLVGFDFKLVAISTYDSSGNKLTYKNSAGYWSKRTYDSHDNQLSYEDSYGCWWKKTYDSSGNVVSYCDSDGRT